MPKKHQDGRGKQKGAVRHAEGQHGKKTRRAFLEQLQKGPSGDERQRPDAAGDPRHEGKGGHRLSEGRQQHDEADLNSEKNRLSRDIDRHGHDREQFQVPGGTENHPRMPSAPGPGKRRSN